MAVRNIISADMGGTTFKVGVVRDGCIEYQHESMVFRYHYALPKMDIVSLGLAGGSVIWFDERTGVAADRAAQRGLISRAGRLRPRRHRARPSPTSTPCSAS